MNPALTYLSQLFKQSSSKTFIFITTQVLQELEEFLQAGQEVRIIHAFNQTIDFTNTLRSHWLWKISAICFVLEYWSHEQDDKEEIQTMLYAFAPYFQAICIEYEKQVYVNLLWKDFVKNCGATWTEKTLHNNPTISKPWAFTTNFMKEKCAEIGSDFHTIIQQWEKECAQKSFWEFLQTDNNIPLKFSTYVANKAGVQPTQPPTQPPTTETPTQSIPSIPSIPSIQSIRSIFDSFEAKVQEQIVLQLQQVSEERDSYKRKYEALLVHVEEINANINTIFSLTKRVKHD